MQPPVQIARLIAQDLFQGESHMARRPAFNAAAAAAAHLADTNFQPSNIEHGGDSLIVCPQCQTSGSVRTERLKAKKGVSGGKATAALLTAGVSMLATGLSRKEEVTRATCGRCKSVWTF
jgi:hypothetical protein